MRTIGYRWNSRAKGDYVERCDYCGMPWKRSQLYLDGAGLYVCPQEGRGRDAVTLDDLNQMRTPITSESDSGIRDY